MLIKLKVHPDSRKNAVERKADDAYEIWTKAPAERGLANEAVLKLLALELKIDAKRIRLIKGGRSPSKIVEVP